MKSIHTPRTLRGQSIYVVMLIISAIALAIATIFPVYEYMAFGYRGALPPPPAKPTLPAPARVQPKAAPTKQAPAPASNEASDTTTETTEPAEDEARPTSKTDTRSSMAYTVTVATSTTRTAAQ